MNQLDPFSQAAREKLRALGDKKARGEEILWTDMIGIIEPNPDLPDCQRYDINSGATCALPNHHDGPHQAVITW